MPKVAQELAAMLEKQISIIKSEVDPSIIATMKSEVLQLRLLAALETTA